LPTEWNIFEERKNLYTTLLRARQKCSERLVLNGTSEWKPKVEAKKVMKERLRPMQELHKRMAHLFEKLNSKFSN
jgi:hypothetical protein